MCLDLRKSFSLICFLAASAQGCALLENQGSQDLGSLQIEAVLVTDTCGPGAGAQGPSVSYEVDLRKTKNLLTWSAQGSKLEGQCDDDGRFRIEISNSFHVRDAVLWLEDPGCDMMQLEKLHGNVELVDIAPDEADEDEADEADEAESEKQATSQQQATSLVATHEFYFAAHSGTQCLEMIGLSKGQFFTLPCKVVYELAGTPL